MYLPCKAAVIVRERRAIAICKPIITAGRELAQFPNSNCISHGEQQTLMNRQMTSRGGVMEFLSDGAWPRLFRQPFRPNGIVLRVIYSGEMQIELLGNGIYSRIFVHETRVMKK